MHVFTAYSLQARRTPHVADKYKLPPRPRTNRVCFPRKLHPKVHMYYLLFSAGAKQKHSTTKVPPCPHLFYETPVSWVALSCTKQQLLAATPTPPRPLPPNPAVPSSPSAVCTSQDLCHFFVSVPQRNLCVHRCIPAHSVPCPCPAFQVWVGMLFLSSRPKTDTILMQCIPAQIVSITSSTSPVSSHPDIARRNNSDSNAAPSKSHPP